MTWVSDIKSWALSEGKNPKIVEGICVRKGWNPKKYTSFMKKDLFNWLDLWYTLSIKALPEPATSIKRKNPSKSERDRRRTKNRCGECNASLKNNKATCDKCLAKGKARVARKALKNLCRCGRKIFTNKSRCEKCLGKLTKSRKTRRKIRHCKSCNVELSPRRIKWCKSCAKIEAKKQAEKRAKKWAEEGRCKNCGKTKKDKNLAWCASCRETNMLIRRIKAERARKAKRATQKLL